MVLDFNISQGEFPYQWVVTEDQSFTLKSKDMDSEWMHSLRGAYSESQYIYGDALRMAINELPKSDVITILSMGLGLGYLELLSVFECVKSNRKFFIESFELEDQLKKLFIFNCDFGLKLLSGLAPEIQISSLNSKATANFNLTDEKFKSHFLDFFINDYGRDTVEKGLSLILNSSSTDSAGLDVSKLKLNGPLSLKTKADCKFHIIFYDAFSSNTQNELWGESFLDGFIDEFSNSNFCIFSTYAKVGSLNRALKKNKFQFLPKKGFGYKRQSSLAIRKHNNNK